MDIGWEGPRRLRECAGFVEGMLTRGGAWIARVIVWPVAEGPWSLVMPSWIAERYWGRVAASVDRIGRIVLDA